MRDILCMLSWWRYHHFIRHLTKFCAFNSQRFVVVSFSRARFMHYIYMLNLCLFCIAFCSFPWHWLLGGRGTTKTERKRQEPPERTRRRRRGDGRRRAGELRVGGVRINTKGRLNFSSCRKGCCITFKKGAPLFLPSATYRENKS